MPTRSKYVMTVQDAARVVGVSERTVYNWVYQEKMEAHKLPRGGWRIPLRAVAKLVGLTEQELASRFSDSVKDEQTGDSEDHVEREGLGNIENLARGGDFEYSEDLREWRLRAEDGSIAEMRIDRTTAAVGNSSLFFEIIRYSEKDYSRPRFSQTQVIEEGKTYTLSAFYKAEKEREANIAVQLSEAPWTLFVERTIAIGTKWQEQWATFTAPQDAEVTIQPARNADSDVSCWVDGVRFYEGEYVPYMD